MKRLTLDIETSPNVADVWSLWNVNVSLNQLRESTRMLSVGAKWYGDRKVHFFSEYHNGQQEMVEGIYELINEADVVIHFNGTKFDMPHLRREFLQAGLGPHRPVTEIDLLRVVKGKFRLPSNKLQYVATELLKLEGKVQHSGHNLWVRCMAGDPKAWARMKQYNIQDVRLTEKVYDELRPWMHNHPNWVLHANDVSTDEIRCTNCGSDNYQRRGYKATLQSVFQQYQCNVCRGWFRGTKRVEGVSLRGNA